MFQIKALYYHENYVSSPVLIYCMEYHVRELIQNINFIWVSLKVSTVSDIRLQFLDNQHGSQ